MAFNDLLSAFSTSKTPIKPPSTTVPLAPKTTTATAMPTAPTIAPLPSYMTNGLYSTATKTTTPSNLPTLQNTTFKNPSAPLTITMPPTPNITPATTTSSPTSVPQAPTPMPTSSFSSGSNFSGSSANTGGLVTSPTGALFNPATGQIEKQGTNISGYNSGAAPTVPTAPTSGAPASPFNLSELEKAYQDNLNLSPEEQAAQAERDRLQESFRKGYQNIEDQTIPMEFITGQQQSLEKRALNLAEPLEATMARLQAKRQASLEASKFALERADKAQERTDTLAARQEDRAFDQKKFDEDTRRFGLEYALNQQKATGTAEGFTLSEGQQRYDAQGNLIATGQAPSGDAGGKIVKINGVDYWQNADGSFDVPNVPEVTAQTSEIKSNALTSAQELLEKLKSGTGTSAVGGSRIFGLQYVPGTAPKDFQIQFDNLKSLLSLDNVKLLKGQGAVSDAERQLLADASSKLNLAQSEGEFKTALESIIKSLDGSMSGSTQQVQQAYDSLNTGVSYQQAVAKYGEAGVRQILQSQGISFNKPLSTGIKGSGQIPGAAIKFPQGTTGGQCTTFLHSVAKFPPIGDGKNAKFASVDKIGVKASQWRNSVRVGDVVVSGDNPTYGHTFMVNQILPGGKIQVTESNYKGDEKVTHSRIVSIYDPKIYGAIRPQSFKV